MARAPSPETSPEVDFGAFLRPRSRNSVAPPNSRPISSYASYASAPRPVRPSPTQQKLGAQPHGRMRQGAPRLGGLGLGGIQSSPSPFAPPPASHTPKRKSPPQSTTPIPSTPATRNYDSAEVGRPFLSPEMEKATLREGAFALDRPIPDLGTSTAPPPDDFPTPDSPSPSPSPFLGLSPPTSPTLNRLDALSAPLEMHEVAEEGQEGASGMMDEVLGLVEAELMGQEAHDEQGQVEISSEEETESESEAEGGSSLASESEEEEEAVQDPTLPFSPASVEPEARSPSPQPSIASADSFHSLVLPQEAEVDSSGSEKSFDGPTTPPALLPAALAGGAVHVEEPTRSIDEVLLADVPSLSAPTKEAHAPEMDRQPSISFSDSSSSDFAPSSPRSSMSRGTSRSTSRSRAPPPPRPPRARRPPGSSVHTSPALSQRTFEEDGRSAPTEKEVEKEPDEAAAPISPSKPTSSPILVPTSHSANSSLSMSSQPSDAFFFVPPPPQPTSPSSAETATAPRSPSSPVVPGYGGLGLRLPSSLRPKSFYADPEATPMGSPTRLGASPPSFPSPPLVIAPLTTVGGGVTPLESPVASGTSSPQPSRPLGAACSPPAKPTPVPVCTEVSSLDPAPLSTISSSPLTPPTPPASVSPAEDLTPLAEEESGLADIGVAAVGALVTGGMAVGYSAWRGLSAVASSGWGWKSAAPVVQPVTRVDEEEEAEATSESSLPRSPVQDGDAETSREVEEHTETGAEQAEIDSSAMSTEWGEVAFPAPEGFIEAFKEAMAQLGPEDLLANDKVELDAQEAAHDLALQLHRESSGTSSSPATFSTYPSRATPFPAPPSLNKRASMISLGASSKRTTDRAGAGGPEGEGDEYDELMELVSPLFDTRVGDTSPTSRYAASVGGFEGGRPLSRTFSGSTESSVSSRLPPSFSVSPSSPIARDTPRRSSTGKSSFFSFGKRRPSIDSSLAPPASSSASTSSHQRAMSIDSGSSDSHDAAKLKRRSSLFGGSSVKSAATLSPPLSSSSPIVSQIVDTTYVSYTSGRSSRRRSSSASTMSLSPSPSAPPPLPPMPASFQKSPRRSSIRLESRYTTSAPVREGKKIYTVRFANADRGIGLRSVAEDEAQRAGGDAHAMKWVGVGRGNRYGNLLIQTDAGSDEVYAEQVAEIKTKWRRFGGAQRGEQRDWTRVKID